MNGLHSDKIIRMAREAGFEHIAEADYWHPFFERFAQLAAAAEREACAQVCEEYYEYYGHERIAHEIRARGNNAA